MNTPTPSANAVPENYQRPTRGAQVDVFISYSRRDVAFTRRLFDRLEGQGRTTWVDWESIPYSVDWWQEIQDGIDSANNVVCVVSTGWLTSEMCNKEFAYAVLRNKRIIPVLRVELDEKQVKTAWIDQPWEAQARENLDALKRINWLYSRKRSDGHEYLPDAAPSPDADAPANDIDNFEQAVQNLIRTIETDNDFIKQHTRLLIGAREWETANRNESYLLHDLELDSAQAWLARSQTKTPKPTPLHLEYITASAAYRARLIAAEAERKQQLDRSARRALTFGRLAAAVGVIAVLLVASAVLVASNQVSNANATLTQIPPTLARIQADIAQGEARIVSLNMASAAEALYQEENGDKSLAAALAVRGLRIAYTEQADAVLVKIMHHAVKRRRMADDARIAVLSPAGDYAAVVPYIAFSAYLYNLRDPGSATILDHESRVMGAVFAPDGRTLLTFAEDRVVRLWDVEEGALIRTFAHERGVNSAVFSPDGRLIMTTTSDFSVHVWDVIEGRELYAIPHIAPIVRAVFAPDGKSIATYTENVEADRVHVWDAASGKERHTLVHNGEIAGAVFAPDSQTILISSLDGVARVWDVNTGNEKFHLSLEPYTSPAAFSPDGSVIIGFRTATITSLWKASTGAPLFTLTLSDNFFSMAISPDSRLIAIAASDNTIQLWEFATGKPLRVIVNPETARKLIFSPDSRLLLAISDSRFARVWDAETGELRRVLTHSGTVSGAAFTPDSALILTSSGGAPQLWETNYADFLADVCSVFSDPAAYTFTPQDRQRYGIPDSDPAPCSYYNEAGTVVPPNPPLPPTMTLAATTTAVPTLLIPTYTPAPN